MEQVDIQCSIVILYTIPIDFCIYININAKVNWDGVQNDNTTLDVNLFHLELGGNPVDLKLHLITPVSDPQVNAQVDANIDFASLLDVIPLGDISLTGM